MKDYNYVDDDTISDAKDTPEELKRSLEHDASNVIDWFDENGIKANTDISTKELCLVYNQYIVLLS